MVTERLNILVLLSKTLDDESTQYLGNRIVSHSASFSIFATFARKYIQHCQFFENEQFFTFPNPARSR